MSEERPPNWAESTVGNCFLEIRNGTTASQNKEGNGLPVSRIETIQNSRFDLNRIRHIKDLSAEAIESFKYYPGDIAFSHINSYEHVGKTAVYEGIPEIFIHGMNLLRLRLGHSHIDSQFAHCFMQTRFFREEVRQRVGHAVNQVSINQKNLADVPFIIAPLPEQRRIVAKLEKLLGKVDACQKRLDRIQLILKRFRQSVLAAACSGRLTEDWREEESETTNASESDDIPGTWSWKTFQSISSEITVGYVGPMAKEYVESGIPFLRSLNVRRFAFDPKDLKFIRSEFHKRIIKSKLSPGDVVVVRSGASGVSCVIPATLKMANCSDLVIIRPGAELVAGYACIFLNSAAAQTHIESAKVGIAQRHFNVGSMKETVIPLPPIAEQSEIVRRVEAFFALADQIQARYQKAQAHVDNLTQSILAKAFRGELVPQDPDDEPAAVLLERIRRERDKQVIDAN